MAGERTINSAIIQPWTAMPCHWTSRDQGRNATTAMAISVIMKMASPTGMEKKFFISSVASARCSTVSDNTRAAFANHAGRRRQRPAATDVPGSNEEFSSQPVKI